MFLRRSRRIRGEKIMVFLHAKAYFAPCCGEV